MIIKIMIIKLIKLPQVVNSCHRADLFPGCLLSRFPDSIATSSRSPFSRTIRAVCTGGYPVSVQGGGLLLLFAVGGGRVDGSLGSLKLFILS